MITGTFSGPSLCAVLLLLLSLLSLLLLLFPGPSLRAVCGIEPIPE